MVTIRLTRGGANKRPFYHIVVADSRCPRDGRNLERIGYFNPIVKDQNKELHLYMDLERVTYWLSKGAKPSERVAALINEAKKMPAMKPVRPVRKPKPVVTARPAASSAPVAKSDKGDKSSGKKPAHKHKSTNKPAAKKATSKN
jgi:small subunit ribosomal protein S16